MPGVIMHASVLTMDLDVEGKVEGEANGQSCSLISGQGNTQTFVVANRSSRVSRETLRCL